MATNPRYRFRLKVLRPRLVLCLNNEGYETSLEKQKLYKAIPDKQGGAAGLIRVIDESGDDYLYPRDFFAPVTLHAALRRDLLQRA
jgi:hypothetical protein